MDMTEVSRLHAARAIYLNREGAPTAGDRWFSLYLIAFVTAFYITPVAYLIGDFLDPTLAEGITSSEAVGATSSTLTTLGLAALLSGRWVQGPAFLTPFLAHTLLGSDLSRHQVLRRPTLSSLLAIATAVTAVAAIGVFALTHAGAWPWQHYGWLLAAAFLLGILWGLLSFLGQRLSDRGLLFTAGILLLLAVLGVLLPGTVKASPFGWAAMIWAGEASWGPVSGLAAVAMAGAVLVFANPSALEKLPAARILAQSRRLSDARLFTSTGNINDAVELFRAKPRRRLSRMTLGSGLRQDAVTALRAPLSLLTAALFIPTGAALLGLTVSSVGVHFEESRLVVTVPLGVLGALLVFFGTGSLTEGWRQVKNEFDAAALFGWSARRAIGRRMLWPLMTTTALTGIGVGPILALDLQGPHMPAVQVVAWTLGMTALALAARFFQSMRDRDIPVEFLAPTVIPGGIDLSAVKILVWLGDGIILTVTGVLAMIILPWETPTLAVTLGVLVLIGFAWGWARTGGNLLTREPKKSTVGSLGA